MRILATQPLLAVRGDVDPQDVTPDLTLATLMHHPSSQADTLHMLDALTDAMLHTRLSTCLDIAPTTPTLVLITSHSRPLPKHTHRDTITAHTYRDGQVILLSVNTPSFAHIARTRPLSPQEQQRRQQLLSHPHLSACIALAQHHPVLTAGLVAPLLGITTKEATRLLKTFAPVFVPLPADHYAYDDIAVRAIHGYAHEATITAPIADTRQHLPDVVRRYCNHEGKITHLPVRLGDRTSVLHYLAQQLPTTPLSEPEMNAAILRHVAFSDYATARRDMVDLGFVTRTANGSVYQRVYDDSN